MIQEFAKKIPVELLQRSGQVFYSGRLAFSRPRTLYLLGLNPGGSAKDQASETIEWHTNRVLTEFKPDWSAYRDESWQGRPGGKWGMQPRVLHLLRQLGMSPAEVPASNVIFLRSQSEALIADEFTTLAIQCWRFHRQVIEQLKPRVILCFGQLAGNWVRGQVGAHKLRERFVENNRRRWENRLYQTDTGLNVVVATHPSRADWTKEACDPSSLVRAALSNPG